MYYIAYKCETCKKETILIKDQVKNTFDKKRYIVCSHCSSKNLKVEKTTDDLREVMGGRAYRKEGGRIKQVRFSYG